jgi:flagellar hook-associated protein FlgK
VLDAIADHTRQINILANKLQDLRNSASQGLSTEIPTINNLLKDIAAINGSIQSSADASGDANVSYSRQRRVLLNQLAEHIQIVVEEGGDSEFLVYTPKGRVLVQGSLAAEFIYNQPAAIDASQTFSAGL